jgi:hypothetical protein
MGDEIEMYSVCNLLIGVECFGDGPNITPIRLEDFFSVFASPIQGFK